MKKLMAANWKMYKTRQQARDAAAELVRLAGTIPADRELLLFAPFTAIEATRAGLGGAPGLSVGGQNCYPALEGAFTGEISPAMLLDAGAEWVLTGHSERRHILGESDQFLNKKTVFALGHGLKAVFCIGETLEQREAGRVEDVLSHQLRQGLEGVPLGVSPADLAIAYEPVWAIGTGKVAQPADILHAHAFVRAELTGLLAEGAEMRILYGGSVKPDNAAAILGLDNVDGVLVGGASLQAESFSRIALA